MGRNPQYTRSWLAREAVACSQNNHHKAQPTTTNEPIYTSHETVKSRSFPFFSITLIHILKSCPGSGS